MNQLHNTKAGNISAIGDDQGATGGQGPPPPPKHINVTNVQIMNEYNSFNLANVIPLVAPKCKNHLIECLFVSKFKHSCQRIVDGPMCHITSGNVKKSMLLI